MAEDWLELQAQIAADLKEDGAEFVFSRAAKRVYNPETGTFLPETGAERLQFAAHGIIRALSSSSTYSSNYGGRWFAGTAIQQGDKILMVDCAAYVPELEDAVELSDGEYVVKAMNSLEPGREALLRYLLVRKA